MEKREFIAWFVVGILFLACVIIGLHKPPSQEPLDSTILGIYFSPDGGCEDVVIDWIGRANQSIHIMIYSFTLDDVGDALVTAHRNGIDVKVIFEKGQVSQYSAYFKLETNGIHVKNDTNSAYMHHKVMIVDDSIVLTGSFNWSSNAETMNNENLIVISSEYVAQQYENIFEEMWNE